MPQNKKPRRIQILVKGHRWLYIEKILPDGKICKATGGRIVPTEDGKKALYTSNLSMAQCRRHAGDAEVREEPEGKPSPKDRPAFDPFQV